MMNYTSGSQDYSSASFVGNNMSGDSNSSDENDDDASADETRHYHNKFKRERSVDSGHDYSSAQKRTHDQLQYSNNNSTTENDDDDDSSSAEDLSSMHQHTTEPAYKKYKQATIHSSTTTTTTTTTVPHDVYSAKSLKMMEKMGYKAEKGLGKLEQGRIEPITASEQKGRLGFGMTTKNLDDAGDQFDDTMEIVHLHEPHEWLTNTCNDLDEINRDELDSWLVVKEKKMFIDDETKFCEPQILADILKSKTIFDNLGADDMRHARTRCNPFETIGRSIFLNRAAVKMANMDAIMNFMFTNPIDEHGSSLVREDDLLYFADVCAGPGGFSEYILWRKNWNAKGFGFTLKCENDFKLHDFLAGNPETFDTYYGINDDGNVFDPQNIKSFQKYVLDQTMGCGVHFMMSDGGFSVENNENIQEILSKQLYLCQCLVALSIVRENGHFVTKIFDIFTPFSVGLIYLMYKCFQQICIFKPNTSRPANSERYLICKWKKSNTDTIQRHLFQINDAMWTNKSSVDTLELVPYNILSQDEQFFNYIYTSNNTIGRNQIAGLLKIAKYCKDKNLKETRQAEIRTDCLKIWQIPDEMRKTPPSPSSEQMFNELLGRWVNEKEFLLSQGRELKKSIDLKKVFPDISTWYFVPLEGVEAAGKSHRTFFMSKGKRDVLMYSPNGTWVQTSDYSICLEMTPRTLIYGEISKEYINEGRLQTTTYGLHIIDGIILGNVDIRNYSLSKRLELCQKFATALNKPHKIHINNDGSTAPSCFSITCKKLYSVRDFRHFFDRLQYHTLKDGKRRLGQTIRNSVGIEKYFVPRGLLFFNELKPNLSKLFSKRQQRVYYVDNIQRHTFYLDQLPDPNVIYASFKSTFSTRLIWHWEMADQVEEEIDETQRIGELLYRVDINRFIDEQVLEKSFS